MKVLLINKFHYKRGGSETYYFALAEALIACGHEVIYFSMQDDKNFPCDQSKYFISNVEYSDEKQELATKVKSALKIFYSIEAKTNIEKLIKDEKPDIAHIGLLHRQITFSVVDALKKHNIPVVMTMHDLIFACPCYTMLSPNGICEDCIDKGVMSCYKKSCIKGSKVKSLIGVVESKFLKWGKYYNKIDLYIAECDMYKELMIRSKFTKSKIISMTNFLPVSQQFKLNLNYKDYILYFGRYSHEKGILTMLAAYKQMNCKNKLIIIGAGPIRQNIENYIKQNQIKNVDFRGAIYGEEMEEIIEKSKVIVAPSEWYENCPYAIMQSMAKGKIVVASRIGGLPELIEDGESGFLFEAGNVTNLANTLKKVILLEKDEYEKISYQILYRAKKLYCWKTYIDKLVEEYRNLSNK